MPQTEGCAILLQLSCKKLQSLNIQTYKIIFETLKQTTARLIDVAAVLTPKTGRMLCPRQQQPTNHTFTKLWHQDGCRDADKFEQNE